MDLLDLVSSDDNIQSRLSDMSPSSFIREKLSDVKCMFEEAKLLFTNSFPISAFFRPIPRDIPDT